MRFVESIREIGFRLRSLGHRRALDAQIDDEMRFHLELLTANFEALGVPRDAARLMARRQFGNATLLHEDARAWWGLPSLDALGRDARHALRRLARSPAFTIVIVLTFAVGLGANTAIFTLVDAALLRPLPYADPAGLVTVHHEYTSPALTMESQISAPGFNDYRHATSFAAAAVERPWDVNVTASGAAERVRIGQVSAGYFAVLGVGAREGRALAPGHDQGGNDRVVVLSDAYWRRELGAAPNVVGRSIELDGSSYVITGVMPASFRDPFWPDARAWTPLVLAAPEMDPSHLTDENLDLVARLRPGVTLAQARSEFARLATRLRQAFPERLSAEWTLSVAALGQQERTRIRETLLVMLGAVALVLLIACTNVASLSLARAAAQRREVAVRTALGGGRAAILRHLLLESGILALAGGVIGVVLAHWSVRVVAAAGNLPGLDESSLSVRVIAFTLGLVALTAIACGLVPALDASRVDLATALAHSTRTSAGDHRTVRLRRGLVAAEIALAVVLVAGAAMMVRSVARLHAIDPGFDPQELLTLKISLPKTYRSDAERASFFGDVLSRIQRIPGVKGVAASNALPFAGNNWNSGVAIDGYAPRTMSDMPWGERRVVNAGFFSGLRIPLRAGRLFTAADAVSGQRVAVVDEMFARRYFGDRSAVGRRLSFNAVPGDTAREWSTIVGVVGHVTHERADAKPRVQMYQLYSQVRGAPPGLELAVRTTSPDAVLRSIRAGVQSADRTVAIADVRSMDDRMEAALGQRRLTMALLETFSAIALFLAAVGVYGAMAYAVAQRSRELGIRRALGATARTLVTGVLRSALVLALAGAAAGTLIAIELSQLIAKQLYGVKPTDAQSLITAAGALVLVAIVAAVVPAIRATRVDAVSALRDQ